MQKTDFTFLMQNLFFSAILKSNAGKKPGGGHSDDGYPQNVHNTYIYNEIE